MMEFRKIPVAAKEFKEIPEFTLKMIRERALVMQFCTQNN